MNRKRMSDEEYLQAIEVLAKRVVHEALGEFEAFADGDVPKTALQQAITDLARELRYTHVCDDSCLE